MRRGLPNRLFVDNGTEPRSRQLALVCAKLDVALLYAKPFQPTTTLFDGIEVRSTTA